MLSRGDSFITGTLERSGVSTDGVEDVLEDGDSSSSVGSEETSGEISSGFDVGRGFTVEVAGFVVV